MHLRELPAERAAVRRWAEDLWLPFNRELEEIVDTFELNEDVDLVEEETSFRLELLEEEDRRVWVAVEDQAETDTRFADIEAEFQGFVTTALDECPSVFDRPDRQVVGDLYVRKAYRGGGLAGQLVERVAKEAEERGASELYLEVDVANDRAKAFYDKLGFDLHRYELTIPVEDL